MLGLTITAVSAVLALGLIVWHKVIVPFDRMNRLSRELDDPGYRVEAAPVAAEAVPQDKYADSCADNCADNYAGFTSDLQMVYKATRPIAKRSPASVSTSRR